MFLEFSAMFVLHLDDVREQQPSAGVSVPASDRRVHLLDRHLTRRQRPLRAAPPALPHGAAAARERVRLPVRDHHEGNGAARKSQAH